jgi:hypothetical protein
MKTTFLRLASLLIPRLIASPCPIISYQRSLANSWLTRTRDSSLKKARTLGSRCSALTRTWNSRKVVDTPLSKQAITKGNKSKRYQNANRYERSLFYQNLSPKFAERSICGATSNEKVKRFDLVYQEKKRCDLGGG